MYDVNRFYKEQTIYFPPFDCISMFSKYTPLDGGDDIYLNNGPIF